MVNQVKNILLLLYSVLFLFLVGCAGNISIQIPSHTPAIKDSQLASIPPQTVHLKTQDARTPGRAEGTREAAFGVPMGNVNIEPPAVEIVKDVIMSELKIAGHTISNTEQQTNISATVQAFEVRTKTTPLYWDIIGDTIIELEVMNQSGEKFRHSYKSTCNGRTYVWPGGELIKKVMQSCIADFAETMRNDKELAEAINKLR